MSFDRSEIESFLYREARIMDEHHYDEWLTLWTEDAVYWIPCNNDDIDPEMHLNIIYDDAERRRFRIQRLQSGAAYSQDPQSRLRRIIGNVEIEEAEQDDEVTVYSNFDVTHLRRGHLDIYAGRQIHKLRRENGELKIAGRKVLLLQNDEPLNNITFLL